jgi:hypothetical protein
MKNQLKHRNLSIDEMFFTNKQILLPVNNIPTTLTTLPEPPAQFESFPVPETAAPEVAITADVSIVNTNATPGFNLGVFLKNNWVEISIVGAIVLMIYLANKNEKVEDDK